MVNVCNKLFLASMTDVHICLGNIYFYSLTQIELKFICFKDYLLNSLFCNTIKILILNKKENKMTKKLENFIDNIIEEKKIEFKGLIGKENRVENMIEDLKTLNLSNDKLEEVIKVAKKHMQYYQNCS